MTAPGLNDHDGRDIPAYR